ncbi:ATP-binding protein [Phytoactinopolyspora alkaliphila]|uniref:ATP-binding protein n=1 Tax=Phytoactinopolyspora alkaliphila TaxID=1783498 RepID=A0A6N9YFF4_9ACTN|nr:ATP-binding protein [Phytoactinopolyspora alkaliphila]NED93736.1 ATP-binding protein [Phytoactinopolyspora alkaliphila]
MAPSLAQLTDALENAAKRRFAVAGEPGPDTERGRRLSAAIEAMRHDHVYPAEQPEHRADGDHHDERVDVITAVFGLDELEAQLLVTALAPEMDASAADAFTLLGGDWTSGRATVALALEMCGVPTGSATGRTLLSTSGRLLRHRLVLLSGDGPFLRRCLRLPDRVSGHLLGDDMPELSIRRLLTPVTGLRTAHSDELARAVAAGAPLSWLHSPPGAPGAEVAAAALEAAGLDVLAADLSRRPPHAVLADIVAELGREGALQASGVVMLGADVLAEPEHHWIADRLLESVVPIVAVARRPWDARAARRLPYLADIPPLTHHGRSALWSQRLGAPAGSDDDPQRHELAALRLDPSQIAMAADQAHLLAAVRDEALGSELAREATRRLVSGTPAVPAPAVAAPARTSLHDIVLPPDAQGELERLIAWGRHREDVLTQGPVQGKGGKAGGIVAMFSGGPGTGKTLAAHVVADALGLELCQVDLSSVVDKYIGETEKNLERVFQQAEAQNALLFFDEADAVFGNRSQVRDARDRYANTEVSYLLQRMEQFHGIAVLATNLRGNIDSAFSRRLHFVVHFPDPDASTRRHLWVRHLDHIAALDEADPVDLTGLSEALEVSGGDIRNIVLSVAYDSIIEQVPAGMRHVVLAAEREYRKLGRRLPDGWPPASAAR